jgi:hypothetical protein
MIPEFEQMLRAVLPATGKTSLTITDIPEQEDQLMQMLETALVNGNRWMPNHFWHVPVEDSGASDVLRLVFEN